MYKKWGDGDMGIKEVTALAKEKRMKIMGKLRKEPTYASELARKIGVERPIICYHLSVLERAGLVSGEYVILEEPSSSGKAAKIYKVNEEKYEQTLEEVKKLLGLL